MFVFYFTKASIDAETDTFIRKKLKDEINAVHARS
jgi:hypothetical protein